MLDYYKRVRLFMNKLPFITIYIFTFRYENILQMIGSIMILYALGNDLLKNIIIVRNTSPRKT